MKSFIRKLANPGKYPAYISAVLLLLRLGAGALILTHGYGKLERLLDGAPFKFADPYGFGTTVSLVLAFFAEFVCAIFIILGFFTRLSAIPLIITMLTAALIIHGSDPIGDKELPLLYALIFMALAFFGAGKYSVDSRIGRK